LIFNEFNKFIFRVQVDNFSYLIGRDRKICYQFADVDIRSRCDPDELIVELRRMTQK
jgi:hypothetical protein